MSRQVSFDRYGGVEVLELLPAEKPVPGEGELLVAVRAAGLNPFDTKVRRGLMEGVFPITLPSTQGTDVAGVVEAVGPGVQGFAAGDEILGSTGRRRAQADHTLVPAASALPRPPALSWEVAGSLWVSATTASAMVRAVAPEPGEIVLVAGASGGVGALVSQLARERGAVVIGVAGVESHAWLREQRIIPVSYGEGVAQRVSAAAEAAGGRLAAVLDAVGGGYVALGVELGVAPQRIDTIVDFDAAARYGARTDGGAAGRTADVAAVLELILAGRVQFSVHRSYPLEQVRDAYRELEEGHPRGKVVLIP